LAWEAYSGAWLGGVRAQRRTARRLARLSLIAAKLDSPYAFATVMMVRAAAALWEHRLSEVCELAEEAHQIFRARCIGTYWEESICDLLRYTGLEHTGPLSAL